MSWVNKCRDLTGQKFNYLTAVKQTGIRKQKAVWLFACDCGGELEIIGEQVTRKKFPQNSCGCKSTRQKGTISVAKAVYCNGYNDGDITLEQFMKLSQCDCFYCGKSVEEAGLTRVLRGNSFRYIGLDRLSNDRGHDLDNVQPCCWTCNDKKSDMDFGPFLEWIQAIYLNRIAS